MNRPNRTIAKTKDAMLGDSGNTTYPGKEVGIESRGAFDDDKSDTQSRAGQNTDHCSDTTVG